MDKYILKLLFDYRGKINYQEFRQGIILLFSIAAFSHFVNAIYSGATLIFITKLSPSTIAQLNSLSYFSIPQLPIAFVLLISSIFIVTKRFKQISEKRYPGPILGILLYLFFHTISFSSRTIFALTPMSDIDVPMEQILFYSSSFLIMLFGGIVVIILGSNVKKETIVRSNSSYMNIPNFINAIGKLLIYFLCALVTVFVVSLIHFKWQLIVILSVITFVAFVVLYVRLAIKRANDAGIRKRLIWIVLSTFIIVIGYQYWFSYSISNAIYYQILTFAVSVIIVAFEICNLILFLAPSRINSEL